MDLADLGDDDWEELLSELRLLVARSGFSAWDAAMASHLDDTENFELDGSVPQQAGLTRLELYTVGFIGFLKIGTTGAAAERIANFRMLVEGAEDAAFQPERAEAVSLASGSEEIDAMVTEMSGFLAAIRERNSSAWTAPQAGS